MVARVWMTPGAYLKRCRNLEGISQRKLAHRVGMSHVFIGNVERGHKMFPLERCDIFECSLSDFREADMRRFHPWGDLSHRWGHEWCAVAWMAMAADRWGATVPEVRRYIDCLDMTPQEQLDALQKWADSCDFNSLDEIMADRRSP